jgi:predicted ATPase
MIKKWSVENFKSVNEKVSLELAPLTIFAGANSSGKSTISKAFY